MQHKGANLYLYQHMSINTCLRFQHEHEATFSAWINIRSAFFYEFFFSLYRQLTRSSCSLFLGSWNRIRAAWKVRFGERAFSTAQIKIQLKCLKNRDLNFSSAITPAIAISFQFPIVYQYLWKNKRHIVRGTSYLSFHLNALKLLISGRSILNRSVYEVSLNSTDGAVWIYLPCKSQ